MKLRFLSLIAALSAALTSWAQTAPATSAPAPKVGVNTRFPSYALDVNGSFQVTDIPLAQPTDQLDLLKWIPNSSALGEDNQGLIVTGGSKDYSKPFQVVNYYFLIDEEGQDRIEKIDLGIPTEEYSIFVTECDLVQVNADNFIEDRTQMHAAFIPLVLLSSPSVDDNPYVYEQLALSNTIPGAPSENQQTGGVQFPISNVHLFPAQSATSGTETWHFFADYPTVKPRSLKFASATTNEVVVDQPTTARYAWAAKMLVVNKSYMVALENLEHDMKGTNGNNPAHPRNIDAPVEIRTP